MIGSHFLNALSAKRGPVVTLCAKCVTFAKTGPKTSPATLNNPFAHDFAPLPVYTFTKRYSCVRLRNTNLKMYKLGHFSVIYAASTANYGLTTAN